MEEKNAEITFPRDWEYRIFCENAKCDIAEKAVRSCVAEMGLCGLNLVAGVTPIRITLSKKNTNNKC